jgi:outer membrane protein assembly factor BamB
MPRKTKRYFIIILLIITPFLSFTTSTNSNLHVASFIDNSNQDFDLYESNDNGMLWKTSSGIIGDITTPLVLSYTDSSLTNQVVFVGTTLCLLKINAQTGDIFWSYSTSGAVLSINIINDLTSDEIPEVLITTNDQLFDNVILLDGESAEILWTFRPEVDVWKEGIGYSQEETISWTAVIIDDITSDSNLDVAITSYLTVYALDIIDGTKIWSYETTDDIWSLANMDDITSDSIGEIALGDQDGNLILLNGFSGNEIWNVKACLPEIYEDVTLGEYTVDRNMFEVEKIDDVNSDGFADILITNERGICAIYNAEQGNLLSEVISFTRIAPEEKEMIYGEPDFYNVIINSIETDSRNVIATMGRTSNVFGNNSLSFLNITEMGLQREWTTSTIDITNVRGIASTRATDHTGNYTKLAIPTGISGMSSRDKIIEIYNLENKLKVDQWEVRSYADVLDFESFYGQSRTVYPFGGNYAYFIDDFTGNWEEEVLVYFDGMGLFVFDGQTGELVWRQVISSKMQIEPFYDVNGDGTIDILRKEAFLYDNYQRVNYFPSLSLICGSTGELLWCHEIPYEDQLFVRGGYLDILSTDDVTGDSIPEFWLAQQEESNFEFSLQNYSRIKLLNGQTGEIVWEAYPTNKSTVYSREQLRLTSITSIEDQNSDSKRDILLSTQKSYVNCLDGSTGELLWNYTRETDPSDNYYRDWIPYSGIMTNVGNLLGNPSEDILIAGDGRIVLVDSYNFSTIHWTFYNSFGWIDERNYRIYQNFTQGKHYIIISGNVNDQPATLFINLETGVMDYYFSSDLTSICIKPFVTDFNDDLIYDHLIFKPWGSETMQEGYYVISGADGDLISFYRFSKNEYEASYWVTDQYFRYGYEDFFDAIGDQTGDGNPDIVVGWSLGSHGGEDVSRGMVLEIIDVKENLGISAGYFDFVPIETDEYSHPPLFPAVHLENIGNITGDGKSEFLVSLVTAEGTIVSALLDLSYDGIIRKQFNTGIFAVIESSLLNGNLSNSIVYSDSTGSISVLDDSFNVEITSFDVLQRGTGKYHIEWLSSVDDVITNVKVDGEIISTQLTDELELYLSPGYHLINIIVTDKSGISVFANISVDENFGNGIFIVWIIVGGCLVAFIGIQLYNKLKKKDSLIEFGPEFEFRG